MGIRGGMGGAALDQQTQQPKTNFGDRGGTLPGEVFPPERTIRKTRYYDYRIIVLVAAAIMVFGIVIGALSWSSAYHHESRPSPPAVNAPLFVSVPSNTQTHPNPRKTRCSCLREPDHR